MRIYSQRPETSFAEEAQSPCMVILCHHVNNRLVRRMHEPNFQALFA